MKLFNYMDSTQKYNFGTSAVIVARVSTAQQTDSPQIEDLRNYAIGLGFKNIKEFGTTESGFLEMDDKQGWNLVVDFFENHPDYRTLICTEISRLSRVKSTLMLIQEYLVRKRIQLIVKDINFFLFNEYGILTTGADIIFTLFASFAASEMSNKRERFRRALKEYKQRGYSIGGKELFGYKRIYEKVDGRKPMSKYIINEKEKEEIIQIYKWYAFGIDGDISITSTRTITEKCIENGMSKYLHSQRNVKKCLKERAYTGLKETHNMMKNPEYWNYKKLDKPKYVRAETYICLYPPIFEGEDSYLFDYVQSRLHENNSKINNSVVVLKETKHHTILSKLLKCPKCGRYLLGEYRIKDGIQKYSYRCTYSRGVVKKCPFTSTLSMQMMDSIIWQYCKKEITSIRIDELSNASKNEIKEIQKKIINIQSALDDYEGLYETERAIFRVEMRKAKKGEEREKCIKEYERKVARIDRERKSLEKRQTSLRVELQELQDSKDLKKLWNEKSNSQLLNKEQIRLYIHKVVKSIEIFHTDKDYTVLKVNMLPYFDNSLFDRYLCIYKRRTQHIEAVIVNVIKKSVAKNVELPIWNNEQKAFTQGSHKLNLQELYEGVFHNNKKDVDIHLNTNIVEYKKLNCYDEDY